MHILELETAAICLFLFFSAVLVPLGWLGARILLPEREVGLRWVSAPGLGLLLLVGLYAALRLLFGQGLVCAGLLWLLLIVFFLLFFRLGGHCSFFVRDAVWHWLAFLLYYLFVILSSAPPFGNFRDTSAELIRTLTGLPIDNLIPFNFARYFVEEIPFSALEVVPTWDALSRGPLSGLGTAAVFTLLGVTESGHWLETSGGVFFVFQCFLIYLNALSLLLIMYFAGRFFGRSASAFSLMLLGSSYFYFVNVIFSWPKFLMAYFVVFALFSMFVVRGRRAGVAAGVFWGAAVLSHDMGWFYLFPAYVLLLLRASRCHLLEKSGAGLPDESFREIVTKLLLAAVLFVVVVSPWSVVKNLSYREPSRLFYLHLFCLKDKDLGAVTFFQALESYLQSNSLVEIAQVKLDNLLYPFNLLHPLAEVVRQFPDPLAMLSSYSHLVFYQLIFALGPPFFFLLLLGVSWESRRVVPRDFYWIAASGLFALLPPAALFGCPLSTWNHHWAYPAFLLLVLLGAGLAAASGAALKGLFVFSFVHNLLLLLLNFWFVGAVPLFIHSQTEYLFVQFGLILAVFFLALIIVWEKQEVGQRE